MIGQLPTYRAVFRVDGHNQMGMGHIMRSVYLAQTLKDVYGYSVCFLTKDHPPAIEMLKRWGMEYFPLPSEGAAETEIRSVASMVSQLGAEVVVFDLRPGASREYVSFIRSLGVRTVVVDDMGEGRLAADLVFYPAAPEARVADWNGFNGRWYEGPQYAIMRPSFKELRADKLRTEPPRVLVSMGGSDPKMMTIQALEALDSMDSDVSITVVLGPAFQGDERLDSFLLNARRQYEILRSPNDMASLFAKADIAIISMGITLYEAATLGVPALIMCPTEKHDEEAKAIEEYGTFVNLGYHADLSNRDIAAVLNQLLSDQEKWLDMSRRGMALVDGCGAQRVANIIHARTNLET